VQLREQNARNSELNNNSNQEKEKLSNVIKTLKNDKDRDIIKIEEYNKKVLNGKEEIYQVESETKRIKEK